ncbi:TPA: hypothetical protein VNE25_001179 [Streptococcus pyogenes]|uniref:hypothetical protein n=1 Tax=Streptococcus pyogenes TaxID=1314 RepID=UPI000640B9A6|nr:hypothetical protein [Streptococcus pyogenes]HER4536339.1 hypothetical protein [Streptococcus pyogenes NGAS757]HER4587727.1 hypothetical protein [Streptococcus pyogenes NGAS615]HER4596215.1 hypothetical protein [Streptococcus pyogenes NGAS613]HER4603072.1 hypothetical protein [Streptococcus pyogenes NGAS608]HER4606224.1 hypothetical protein [Streptococcus pyogenes NGAS609]HER4609642.1 hypothetical protein [Streptococcus pyogenes NGAS601]HER4614872.1 hypothetical protein [Streptococcus pyo
MKQQSYQPLRFVYLLVALFAAMLLVARPVMADEEQTPEDRAYSQGLEKGTEAGRKAGEEATWTDLTPTVPTDLETPDDIEDTNKQLYKEGYTDGYKEGYNEGFGEHYPLLIPVQFIWGIILHWWEMLS